MAELFQKDPAYALELLNSILEDGEQGELLIALRQMTKALGGVQSVAEKANLNSTQAATAPSPRRETPALSSLAAILKAMGLRLAVRTGRGSLSKSCAIGGFAIRSLWEETWNQHWGRMRGGECVRSGFGAYCIYPAVSPRPAQPPAPVGAWRRACGVRIF